MNDNIAMYPVTDDEREVLVFNFVNTIYAYQASDYEREIVSNKRVTVEYLDRMLNEDKAKRWYYSEKLMAGLNDMIDCELRNFVVRLNAVLRSLTDKETEKILPCFVGDIREYSVPVSYAMGSIERNLESTVVDFSKIYGDPFVKRILTEIDSMMFVKPYCMLFGGKLQFTSIPEDKAKYVIASGHFVQKLVRDLNLEPEDKDAGPKQWAHLCEDACDAVNDWAQMGLSEGILISIHSVIQKLRNGDFTICDPLGPIPKKPCRDIPSYASIRPENRCYIPTSIREYIAGVELAKHTEAFCKVLKCHLEHLFLEYGEVTCFDIYDFFGNWSLYTTIPHRSYMDQMFDEWIFTDQVDDWFEIRQAKDSDCWIYINIWKMKQRGQEHEAYEDA